jgi:glycosyltransferase involved in cell wall biosynthesis
MIGICAPYTWADTTYMAIGLSEYIVKLGLSVSIRSVRVASSGVHDDWDSKILKGRRTAFKNWASKCSHIVWFEPQAKNMATAKKLDCKNILVLTNPIAFNKVPSYLHHCDYIITPTEFTAEGLRGRWKYSNIHGVPWDVGLPIMEKTTAVDPDRLWLYAPIQGAAANAFGSNIFFSIQVILEARSNLNVTVSYSKRLDRRTSGALGDVVKNFGDRINIVRKPTYQQRIASYVNHDWTFWSYHYDNSGVVPLESLCSGTPVITYSSYPMEEIILDGHNGAMIPTTVKLDNWDLPTLIEPSPKELVDGLRTTALDTALQHRLSRRSWPELEQRRRTFQAVWKMMLELT